MARVPASETTRKRLTGLFGGEFDKSALMREAIRLIIEETLDDLYPDLWTSCLGLRKR